MSVLEVVDWGLTAGCRTLLYPSQLEASEKSYAGLCYLCTTIGLLCLPMMSSVLVLRMAGAASGEREYSFVTYCLASVGSVSFKSST